MKMTKAVAIVIQAVSPLLGVEQRQELRPAQQLLLQLRDAATAAVTGAAASAGLAASAVAVTAAGAAAGVAGVVWAIAKLPASHNLHPR